ncbi:hypothetical protein [Kitasatospora herbaricolor]|uniref:hypothetical protein n=1 Tax=Kitasatospora herbaricolor TaxID=68217 RepID=UPI0036DAF49C
MTSPSTATLRSRYAEQAASDLAENRRRQQELGEQLAILQQEEALLLDILALAEHYQGEGEAPPLPEQAQEEPVPARAARRRSGSGRARSGTAAHTARAGSARGAAVREQTHRPLLGDLLTELLAGHSEPCLAKDLRDELLLKHPDREPTPQVVRNTLESLVAKGRIRRHKEQRSVAYDLGAGGRPGAVPGPAAG